jgi:hypothetical protein
MSEHTDRINTLERLPRRRSPERDLWPGIEARLQPRRSRYAWGQLALAASLVAGLAALFTLTLRQGPADVGNGLPTYVAGDAHAAAGLQLSDDSRAIVEANLDLVRQAEGQLQQALLQDPDSPTLRSLLASAENRQRTLRAML